MNPSSFTFWIDLNQLMQRWNTNIVENIFEAVRAGLPAYEEPNDVDLIGMIEIDPHEISDRYFRPYECRLKPLNPGSIRFKAQEIIAFDPSNNEHGREVITWDIRSQVDLSEMCNVTTKTIRNWITKDLRHDGTKKHFSRTLTAEWLEKTGKSNELKSLNNSK